jgi:hypothetical protein
MDSKHGREKQTDFINNFTPGTNKRSTGFPQTSGRHKLQEVLQKRHSQPGK